MYCEFLFGVCILSKLSMSGHSGQIHMLYVTGPAKIGHVGT